MTYGGKQATKRSGGRAMADKISGGYVLQARKLYESAWWYSATAWGKILWPWLYAMASWKAYGRLKRGQLIATIQEMADACSYKVGYRTERPSKDQIWAVCEALREAKMITTAKTTRGLIITICNYDYYQNPDNYETNNENDNDTTTSQRSADTIDKKGRIEEGKKEEQDPPPAAPPAPYRQFTDAFCQLWANKHGAEYHWLKGDGPQAAEIWEVVHHDLAEGKRITKAYLADSDKYLQGHTIRKLAGEINRYLGTKSNVDPVEAAYPRRNPTPEEIALAYGQEADNGHA